jgi:3-hydroxyacyl-CoA dehydrogenase/enoyl-CoA hydratase/3-hydroxybutyryl-CoA epimerase
MNQPMSSLAQLQFNVDADGIATVLLDVPAAPLNPLSDALVAEFNTVLDQVVTRADICGLVVSAAKAAFAAGWNLIELLALLESVKDARELHARTPGLSRLLRRLETCGKPVAAAVNGLALGGGLELALASHYRVLADSEAAKVGLPEVLVGLLPGAGGTQRLPRLIGVEPALRLMLDGKPIGPQEALKLGIVHELAPADAVIAHAKRWLLSGPEPVQPWDRKGGGTVPGGRTLLDPGIGTLFMLAVPAATRTSLRNYPAPAAILASVYEGLQVPIDRGLAIERRRFARLAAGPEARNLVRTMFVNKGKADKLARRPTGVAERLVKKLAVLGAGMMGAGLAHVAARAGMQVAVLDTTQALADRAREHATRTMERDQKAGRISVAKSAEVLERITCTTDYALLAGSDFVIEAVFEDRAVKAEATRRAEAVIAADAVFATNTSTLPITGLATASKRPQNFIGMHFFSPVERMPLVEIIRSKTTDDTTLAWTLDLAKRLGKTPIVVYDSRGFYTSRVFGTYCYEGQMLLQDGVAPALIENGGRFAGMPVGPLAVMDEVSLELQYKVVQQARVDLGADFREPVSWAVLRKFVEDLRRVGRKAGAGFYEYPADGRKFLWPGLAQHYPVAAAQPALEVVKQRLLYIQALEAARCLEEGVLTSPADGDLGSILGWGFPTYTGGALSLIDMVGPERFVAQCRQLADRYGARFEPCDSVKDLARRGSRYYAAA